MNITTPCAFAWCLWAGTALAFEATFADPRWDGETVPAGQQCQRFGGDHPGTPALHVTGIPAGTGALVLEFSDRSYPPMNDGGHGRIGWRIAPGSAEVTVPSAPGHSFELPDGFFIVEAHRAPGYDTAGAYMPPCSGGKGNLYAVTVKAVRDPGAPQAAVLGETVLDLGRY